MPDFRSQYRDKFTNGHWLDVLDDGNLSSLLRGGLTNENITTLQSQYTLHGQFMESVDSEKYLGVNISQDLNWNHHVNIITGKANRTLGFVKRNVKTKNEAVKELAYKTLV